MFLERTNSAISLRTRGRSWDTVPGSETKDGYVRIWVNYRGRVHHKRWIRVADLDSYAEHIKLFQPVTLNVPDRAVAQ